MKLLLAVALLGLIPAISCVFTANHTEQTEADETSAGSLAVN